MERKILNSKLQHKIDQEQNKDNWHYKGREEIKGATK